MAALAAIAPSRLDAQTQGASEVAKRVLSVGFDYHDLMPYGLPPVGAGEAAAEVADVLRALPSSTVFTALDEPDAPCRREKLASIIDDWKNSIGPGDVAVIYYSGHGAVYDGHFHLIAPDPLMIPFQDVLDAASERRPSAVVAFIDACRIEAQTTASPVAAATDQRPIDRRRLNGGDPEQIRASARNSGDELLIRTRNIALIYSTTLFEQATAGDQSSWRTPFTSAIVKYVGARESVATVFSLIIGDVEVQQPWVMSSLNRPVYLAGEPFRFGRARDAWLNVPH